ncbi:Cell surface protein precursor [compost metagenome]
MDSAPDWAAQAIAKVTKAGLMKGIGNKMFAPESEVTRAQMAVIVDQILTNKDWKPATDSVELMFGDVDSKHWAHAAIQNSARAGVMTGVSKGKFDMKQIVTGAQLEQIMQRLDQVGTK